mmetsp:Transcript_44258/g.111519  ORF Transcript_44258/g.111519 Transcript_44258/m.111519 type:complete len:207 (-) Transcript_44258:417-1037(-)
MNECTRLPYAPETEPSISIFTVPCRLRWNTKPRSGGRSPFSRSLFSRSPFSFSRSFFSRSPFSRSPFSRSPFSRSRSRSLSTGGDCGGRRVIGEAPAFPVGTDTDVSERRLPNFRPSADRDRVVSGCFSSGEEASRLLPSFRLLSRERRDVWYSFGLSSPFSHNTECRRLSWLTTSRRLLFTVACGVDGVVGVDGTEYGSPPARGS